MPPVPQIIEANDCHQASAWHDGLNVTVPSNVLEPQSAKLTAAQQEQFNLSIVGSTSEGRKLMTMKGAPPGSMVCPVSCLFFNDLATLVLFLKLPGNAQFGSRVVQIQNVRHNRSPGTVWAVMVGVARFVQHFVGQHASPNCILEFEESKGFNSNSLNLLASTHNGVGISPNSPLLLNSGADFDIEAAMGLASRDDASFRGALALLKAEGINTFDLTMNGARLRPVRFGSRSCPERERHFLSFVGDAGSGAGRLVRTASFFGGLNFTGFAIAVSSRKSWNTTGPFTRFVAGLKNFLDTSFKSSTGQRA